MVMSLFVIILVGVIAYVWSARGLYSALVHMLCVIVAGAIAFALWEPLAHLIMGQIDRDWVVDIVWGVSLAVPFAASLALLRLAVDALLRANADLDGVANFVGGALCGAISGIISIGILVIAIGFLRMPPSIMGYRPIEHDGAGNVVRQSSLILPVDRLTVLLYEHLSQTGLRTSRPLALWRPHADAEAGMLRVNFNEGRSRNALVPDGFNVLGRYVVGETPGPLAELTGDTMAARRQNVTNLSGEPITGTGRVEGFLIRFGPQARERTGRVVIGNTQVRLICKAERGDGVLSLNPFAMVSQASGDDPNLLGRWRFERPEVFIASVGGTTESPMAFEFAVPHGYQPFAIYVKGVRHLVQDMQPAVTFPDIAARDGAIRSGAILTQTGAGTQRDLARSPTLINVNVGDQQTMSGPIQIQAGLPGRSAINVGARKGLTVDEERRITGGEARFTNDEINAHNIPWELAVRQFAASADTVVTQLNVSFDSDLSLLSDQLSEADFGLPPFLVDDRGQIYQAVGFVYRDTAETHVRYTPNRPLARVRDLPRGGPTPARPDQQFILLFRVSRNVNITSFAIGDTIYADFNPPVSTRRGR